MSLRARLLLAVGAVALVALLAADFTVYTALRTSLTNSIDSSLDSSQGPIERAVVTGVNPGGPNRPPAPGAVARSGTPVPGPAGGIEAARTQSFCDRATALAAGAFVAILGSNRQPLSSMQCAGLTAGGSTYRLVLDAAARRLVAPSNRPGAQSYFNAASTAGAGELRVGALLLANGDVLVIALPLESTNRTLAHLLLIEALTTAGALVLALILGSWLVRIGLRPLREVEQTASAITAGNLTLRVPGEQARTEVGAVALAINSMLGQIEGAFAERDQTEAELRSSEDRLRQFVADASHELRTPIAAVAAYAELFSKGASDHEEDLQRVISGIRSETARMGNLVQDLLLLARLDEGKPLEHRSVELVALVSEAIRTANAVGPQWPVTLVAERPVELDGDPSRLRQVVDNLLANVRAHTPQGTRTTVRVGEQGSLAVIEVEDEGPGIPPDQAPLLFERFYRADPSRARLTGGAGLGLAIVASIVAAHHGHVEVTSVVPHGAAFRIVLPITGDAGLPPVPPDRRPPELAATDTVRQQRSSPHVRM